MFRYIEGIIYYRRTLENITNNYDPVPKRAVHERKSKIRGSSVTFLLRKVWKNTHQSIFANVTEFCTPIFLKKDQDI